MKTTGDMYRENFIQKKINEELTQLHPSWRLNEPICLQNYGQDNKEMRALRVYKIGEN